MDESDLDAILADHAARHSVPGASLGLLRSTQMTTSSFGVVDVGSGGPVTSESRFTIGSLTKPMVATVIAKLAAAARLSLEDPVAAHVPELRRAAWANRATIRSLLANRSGLPLRSDLEFGFDMHADTDDAALSRMASEVAQAEPAGDFWSYSNVGWCLLGRAIETVTGTTWEAAMADLLFDRIGMSDARFATALEPMGRVSGHQVTSDGPVPVEPLRARAYGPAGTSIVATTTDLLRFAAMHLDDASLETLRVVDGDVAIAGWFDAWGLGWARFDWAGGEVWGWDGLIDGERSILRIMPAQRAAVVLLTNGSTGRAMYRSLLAELMPPLFGFPLPPPRLVPIPGSAGDLSRFAGTYAWPDRRVDVRTEADHLILRSARLEAEVFPVNDRTFLVDPLDPDDATVTFGAFDASGRPHVLYQMLWGLPRIAE